MVPSRYPNRLLLAFIAFLALILIGTSGYHWIENISIVDSLYMTTITISTVGFGEVRPLSPAGRMFTIGLIIGGGGIAAYTFGATAEFILSGEWQAFFEKRRYLRMVSALSEHVIVCGFGRVGRRIAHELMQEKVPFIVVDIDHERIKSAQTHGYIAIVGNAANEHVLQRARIEAARALVAAVNSDAENVFIVLTARALNPKMQIVARANYEDSEPKMMRAGANHTIVPYTISGKRIVTMLMRPSVSDFLDEVSHVSGLEFLIEQVEIKPDSPLAGKSLEEINLRKTAGVTVLAYRNPQGQFNTHPDKQTMIEPGGFLILLGTYEDLRGLIKFANSEALS